MGDRLQVRAACEGWQAARVVAGWEEGMVAVD